MSIGTKIYRLARSDRIFKVNRILLGDDFVVEKFFRGIFIKPGCFQLSFNNLGLEIQSLLVLEVERKKGWLIGSYTIRSLDQNGQIVPIRFCEKDERTCLFLPPNSVFQGLSFAISGRGQRWYKKEILRSFLGLSGADLVPIITKNVDFLVLARSNQEQDNAKIRFAKKHGIQIISPRELMAIWFSEFRKRFPEELNVFLQSSSELDKEPVLKFVQP